MRILVILLFLVSCASKTQLTTEQKKAKLYYNKGTDHLRSNEYTKALKNLVVASQYNNEDPQIFNNLGMAYYFKGDTSSAIKNLEKCLELDPKNGDARNNLATIYLNNKNYSKAEKQYNELLKDLTYINQFKTYYNLGVLKLQSKNYSDAIKNLQAALKENENFCAAHFKMGEAYNSLGDYKKAYNHYKQSSMGLCFKEPKTHYMQAKTLVKLGKKVEAQLKFEEILETFPLTKYETMARSQLTKLKLIDRNNERDRYRVMKLKRKILSPDF